MGRYLMDSYDDALGYILSKGIEKRDRTGVGCMSVAGIQVRYDLSDGTFSEDGSYTCVFPLVTKRKLFPKSVFAELIWFLSGSTLNQDLVALGAKFWSPWCDENNAKYRALREKHGYEPGDFGPIYGWQLRHFGSDYIEYQRRETHRRLLSRLASGPISPEVLAQSGFELQSACLKSGSLSEVEVRAQFADAAAAPYFAGGFDQLKFMIDTLKNDPFGSNGRRCLFSLWNPADLDKMALPPCHYTYQAIADGDGGLTGILTQRSNDVMIGNPANIQFYSALTIMLAQQSGFRPREFIHNMNDAHIYLNQVDQVKEYLSREAPPSPRLRVNKAKDIFSYAVSDFEVTEYNPLEKIDVPVAV